MQEEPKPEAESEVFLADAEDMKPPEPTADTGQRAHKILKRALTVVIVVVIVIALLIWTGAPLWLNNDFF